MMNLASNRSPRFEVLGHLGHDSIFVHTGHIQRWDRVQILRNQAKLCSSVSVEAIHTSRVQFGQRDTSESSSRMPDINCDHWPTKPVRWWLPLVCWEFPTGCRPLCLPAHKSQLNPFSSSRVKPLSSAVEHLSLSNRITSPLFRSGAWHVVPE